MSEQLAASLDMSEQLAALLIMILAFLQHTEAENMQDFVLNSTLKTKFRPFKP